MTTETKTIMICATCGSTDVRADAYAGWCAQTGEWVLITEFDNKDCEECGCERDLTRITFPCALNLEYDDASETYSHLTVSPVWTEPTSNGTALEVCDPTEAEIWTVYAVGKDGMSQALHDEKSASAAALALRGLADTLNLPVTFCSSSHVETEIGSLNDLDANLAAIIRSDDDSPLAQLRQPLTQIKEAA